MTYHLKYYAAFASDESFGSNIVRKLYNFFENIEQAWNVSSSDLHSIENITEKKITSFLSLRDKINPDEELEKLEKSGFSLLTYEDEVYPELLKQIPDYPMWLYYKGNIELVNSAYKIAVVGSRKCSDSGRAVLRKIISEFKNSDLCIVSGLAAGIDETAHQAALDNNLPTIAVLGSGLQNIYPAKNKKLFSDIFDKNGLVLSEYPLNAKPEAFHFPLRNRIVSGLCKGTLVAEAAIKSGALITAKLALEQGRELMCIPGAIANPATEGIYKLLKDGASLVTCGGDILNCMGWQLNKKEKSKPENIQNNNYTKDENLVLNTIRHDSLTIDELALKTGLQLDDLMLILTRLELEDLIIQTDGGIYTAI